MSELVTKTMDVAELADAGSALLLPTGIDETSTAVLRALARGSVPKNTRTSLQAAIRYWQAWHTARYQRPLPLPVLPVPLATVLTYVADHTLLMPDDDLPVYNMPEHVERELLASGAKRRQGPSSYATWTQRLALLSAAHRALGLPNACRDPAVRDLVRKAKKPAAAHHLLRKKRLPALRDAMESMLATCDTSIAGIRDRALLLFGFGSGGRRRSEIAAAVFEQLKQHHENSEDYFIYQLTDGKRQEAGDSKPKPLRGRAAEAMEDWIAALESENIPASGPIFRSLKGAKRIWIGNGLTGHAVNEIFKRRAKLAGLPAGLTVHGLRGGFMTEAHRAGFNILDAMALSDHKDIRTVKEHYHTDVDAAKNPAGRLLG